MSDEEFKLMSRRFRGFYPVVVDVETGGFDEKKDALLEIGALTLKIDENGMMTTNNEYHAHVNPFEGANMEPASLEINGIDPYHPFRVAAAKDEETAVRGLFRFIQKEMKQYKCKRAIMIGVGLGMAVDTGQAAAKIKIISPKIEAKNISWFLFFYNTQIPCLLLFSAYSLRFRTLLSVFDYFIPGVILFFGMVAIKSFR